jgi:hypothetical protein
MLGICLVIASWVLGSSLCRRHKDCISAVKPKMEKRVIGIILTFLGIAGLVLGAVNFMQTGGGMKNVKEILIYLILGAIFFFAGISLIRTTHDRPS